MRIHHTNQNLDYVNIFLASIAPQASANIPAANTMTSTTAAAAAYNGASDENDVVRKLWSKFDGKSGQLVQDHNPQAAAIIEVKNYLQEPLLGRAENPIKWWNQRKTYYPRLFVLAMARLCVMATSVPSERIFSKAGQVVSDRRCSLSAIKVKQTLFLHYNM